MRFGRASRCARRRDNLALADTRPAHAVRKQLQAKGQPEAETPGKPDEPRTSSVGTLVDVCEQEANLTLRTRVNGALSDLLRMFDSAW